MQDGQTCMTDEYATNSMHEMFSSKLASMHDQSSTCASPTIVHDLKSKHASPTIINDDKTTYLAIANTHNNKNTWRKQSYYDLAKILARPSNCQDHECEPHQCGTSQSKFYVSVHTHQVPLAKLRNRLD